VASALTPGPLTPGAPALGALTLDLPARWTDETMIAEIRRVAALVPQPVYRLKHLRAHSPIYQSQIRRHFGCWHRALLRAGLRDRAGSTHVVARPRRWQRMSDDALLDEVRRIAGAAGSAWVQANQLRRVNGYLPDLLKRRFGSWRRAVALAGLSTAAPPVVHDDAACFDNLRLLWLHYRRPPMMGEADRAPSTVGSHVYQRRWYGWRPALQAFVDHVNATPGDKLRGAVLMWTARAARQDASGMARPGLPPAERHSMAHALRLKILTRDKFRCVLCGATPARDPACSLEIDHIKPFARGGRTEEANLRTLCHACNAGRGAGMGEDRGAGADEEGDAA